ncbi:MAG: hypothetical protein ACREKJ_10160 [Candidatus Rokuibacteriota bacterium]
MAKRWIFTSLTVAMVLGLIGLLAYTSESVHRVAAPARTITEVERPPVTPAPAEREVGPTFHGTGLMLAH